MQLIKKPMLAIQADLMQVDFPTAVTPKIDGIRALVIDGEVLSRSLKRIRNKAVQEALSGLPTGLDGELVALSNNFQDSTSAVMSETSEIAWKYCVFDYVDPSLPTIQPYTARLRRLRELKELGRLNDFCEVLEPTYVHDIHELLEVSQQHLADGFEGSILRKPDGGYKFGRSTVREGLLLKVKQFTDAEARIIGFQELQHNFNEPTINALGLTERGSSKGNKSAGGTLGAFEVELVDNPSIQFKIGTGMTAAQRDQFWRTRDELLGALVKFKYFDHGVKGGVPRHPVLIGFRDPDDLS